MGQRLYLRRRKGPFEHGEHWRGEQDVAAMPELGGARATVRAGIDGVRQLLKHPPR